MPQLSIGDAYKQAVRLHQSGQLQQAEQLYRQILVHQPDHAGALQYLGLIAHQSGRSDVATDLIRRSISINSGDPQAHFNLGNALRTIGRVDEAIAAHRQAIALQPNFSVAHYNLGNALRERGRFDEAAAAYRQAVGIQPDFPEALYNLGCTLRDGKQQPDEAIAAFRQAIALRPNFADARFNLANTLQEQGKLDDAIAQFRQAIAQRPDHADTHNNLGAVLAAVGNVDEAIVAYRRAIALNPSHGMAHNNLAALLGVKGQLDEALAECRHAIRLTPSYAEAYGTLGNALRETGQLDQAIAAYRQAIELRPDYTHAHNNLIYALYFHPNCETSAIVGEQRSENQRHIASSKPHIKPHSNDRDGGRRLRIGYVSPDFRAHPVGRFLLPLLENHNHRDFEIIAYCNAPDQVADEMTGRLRDLADVWRNISGVTDEAAVDRIRQDRIDILVDLTLHMANNRLPLFARKPAPIQVTYLAYAGSSGLSAMDYRLSDPYLDPPGEDESIYSEKTVRLPETYWCYSPPIDLPIASPPVLENGFITFGSLNSFSKVNEPLLVLWARALNAVPKSRLILHAMEGAHRQRVLNHLQENGVENSRITFAGKMQTSEYFASYQSIDIALDTTPYGGGTTTCDALWMGVPVVSIVGRTAVGRGGLSILSNLGLRELVARTSDEYVQISAGLANNVPQLGELRATLRDRMKSSPLMDAPKFARDIEAAFRQMWQTWCEAESKDA